jgi:hypothetical protein
MTYPYIKFELNVCNPYRDNERKLKFLIFFCSRGITLTETSVPKPNSNLTCAFLWRTYTCNLNLIHESTQKLESVNLKFQFFSKFKRGNSVKNQWTITKFELDLRISMTKLHTQFEPYTYIQTKVRERKLKFISRGITLLKNHPTMTKFELDLHNPMMYSYTKFEFNECNLSRDNEQKPFMEWRNDRMTEWRKVTLYAPGHFMAGA